MEIAGLVVGGASLVGLYSACLEAIDRVQAYKHSEVESQRLSSQFEANKIIFREWAERVGIAKDGLLESHDPRLDDQYIARIVSQILIHIRRVLEGAGQPKDIPDQGNTDNYLFSGISFDASISRDPISKFSRKREKVLWAFHGKQRFSEQVELFKKFNECLNGIIPSTNESQSVTIASQLRQTEDIGQHILNMIQIEIQIQKDQKRKAFIDQIGPVNYSGRYESCNAQRTQGTCSWIFNKDVYLKWRSPASTQNDVAFLWIHGPAGYGKSTLCAAIVDSVKLEEGLHCAYYFYSSTSTKQEALITALKAWIIQMVIQDDNLLDLALSQWHESAYQVGVASLWKMFALLVRSVTDWIFVIDGIDECHFLEESDRDLRGVGENRFKFLQSLREAIASTSNRVLVVSRDEVDIRSQLGATSLQKDNSTSYEYKIVQGDVNADTLAFAQSVMDSRLPNKTDTVKNHIAKKINDKCDGMFLWIELQRPNLRCGKNEKYLLRIIEAMPAGLESVYERNWKFILEQPSDDRSRALNILRWATFAIRPLTVAELTDALLVPEDEDCEDLLVDDLPDCIDEHYVTDQIIGLCGPLIEVRDASGPEQNTSLRTVHLKHFSVKQFLLSAGACILLPDIERKSFSAHDTQSNYLALTCLRYLQYKAVTEASSNEGTERAFVDYATKSWYQHLPSVGYRNQDLKMTLNKFFAPQNECWDAWSSRFDELIYQRSLSDWPWGNVSREDSSAKRLTPTRGYYAALFGLEDVIEFLYSEDMSAINAVGGHFGTPAKAAYAAGHLHILRRLVELGADLNNTDGLYGDILIMASFKGDIDICRYVLDRGVSVSATAMNGIAPIRVASMKGHFEVVKLLLDRGTDLAVSDEFGETPVIAASFYGHTQVVRLLLDRGADLAEPNNDGWTPLEAASFIGYIDVVKLLLDRGADLAKPDNDGRTPLRAASANGHIDVVKLLLDYGADLAESNNDGSTSLQAASANGHIDVVKLLLDCGADLAEPDNDGWTPLQAASYQGHIDVVKLLLDRGADLAESDNDGWTSLQVASTKGHIDVVKLLLDCGADLAEPNNHGWTPLQTASYQGHIDVVKLLLDCGADLAEAENSGCTPINHASYWGHSEVVKTLLDHGADIKVDRIYGETPSVVATRNGKLEVVKLLLASGQIEISAVDYNGRSLLVWAVQGGNEDVVQLLIDTGQIELDSKDRYGQTPFSLASRAGHETIVKLLLSKASVNPDSRDTFGRTPLTSAAAGGYSNIVEMILQELERRGLPSHRGDVKVSEAKKPGKIGTLFCDICLMFVPVNETYHHCQICDNDDFDICQDCVACGAHCYDVSHKLTENNKREDVC